MSIGYRSIDATRQDEHCGAKVKLEPAWLREVQQRRVLVLEACFAALGGGAVVSRVCAEFPSFLAALGIPVEYDLNRRLLLTVVELFSRWKPATAQ